MSEVQKSPSILGKILIAIPYAYGVIDMFFRFSPTLIMNFNLSSYWEGIIDEYFIYYSSLQYLPHIMFLFLYVGIVRSSGDRVSYFIRYNAMQYLILFTAEQLLYDLFLRTCFNYLDTTFTFTVAFLCVVSITLLSLDCVLNILTGRYNEIPIITDAVLVHIGDKRRKS